MIKLSIIIPMYNVEQYLKKCVASTFNQGLSESEFEVIMINDESPDNSYALANKIAKQHNNIKVISQKNKGLGGARNTGIQHAKGQYLLFLDADDYLLPNAFKNITDLAINNTLDVLEFGSQGVLPNGKITYTVAMHSKGEIYSGVEYFNRFKYMNSACNKLYNRKLLIENENLFLEKIYIEDFEFNTRVFYYSKKVMAIDTIGAHYLQSPDSITRNTSEQKKEKMLQDLIQVLKITKAFSQKKEQNQQNKNYFNYRLCFINVTIFYQLLKNKKSYKAFINLKEQLKKENLFHVKHPLSEPSKNLFRKTFLHHFWLFKITQPLQHILFK
ncbi:glycosyltransferase family 2 protein [Gelatiniphilus marinus]|uniref:Glycosyltransferase family 2 protein n=1 Tax=Gelatiniphilus marinus TaxID=1759464 RepID=A0ABW5JRE7_9FLAO